MKLSNSFKERKSLGQDVFEYLKNAIIDQTIKPGSRLVESKIADMLGISRTPLREALHKLERGASRRKPRGSGTSPCERLRSTPGPSLRTSSPGG